MSLQNRELVRPHVEQCHNMSNHDCQKNENYDENIAEINGMEGKQEMENEAEDVEDTGGSAGSQGGLGCDEATVLQDECEQGAENEEEEETDAEEGRKVRGMPPPRWCHDGNVRSMSLSISHIDHGVHIACEVEAGICLTRR